MLDMSETLNKIEKAQAKQWKDITDNKDGKDVKDIKTVSFKNLQVYWNGMLESLDSQER